MTAPDLSPAEAARVAEFDAAEPAPESYAPPHRMSPDCPCGPVQHSSGAWDHQ